MSRTAADEGRLVYVGNLTDEVRERDLGEMFDKYGKIVHIEIKVPPRPPNFAFIEFGDWRDAEDAVRGRDGRDLMGARIRVEVARGRPRGGDRFDDRRRAPPASTGFRLCVRGLPDNTSWQDLKDHFRKVAPPVYSDVKRSRNGPLGIVEFDNAGDMDRAIREMDGTYFRNHTGESKISVMEDKFGPPGGPPRGRGPPPGRGRYRSRSPPRGRRPRSFSPRGRRGDSRSPSPRGRPYSRSPSPRGRPYSRSPSPRGRPYSRSPSPRGRPGSRSPSPRGRPDSRSPSPRRSRSPVGRYEPRED